MAMKQDDYGNWYDDGEDNAGGGGAGGGGTPQPPSNDPATVKNRTAQLRALYWKYLFRLPTQDEFNGMALANGRLTDEDSWGRVKAGIPTSQAAELAMREVGNGKPNPRTVPSGYDFGSSQDYDPLATGTSTGTGAGTGAGGGTGGGTGYNLGQLKAAWLGAAGKYAPTRAGLAQFITDNSGTGGFAEGVTIGGSKKNKLYLGNESGGTFLGDVIRGTDSDNPTYDWDTNTGSGGGGNQSTTTGTGATPSETPAQRAARLATFGLGPEGLQNQRPGEMPPQPTLGDMMGQQGPIANPGTYTPGEAYNAPDYMAPAPFSAPTAAEMGQDPGYQFRLSEGQRALERSGAARGVTNTGGNMKGLLDYGQRAASQEYGNVYDRNLNTYNTNAQNAFQQYSTNALKNNAFNTETEGRRSGAFGTNTGLYQQQQTDAYNRRQKSYDDAMAAYQTKFNNQRQYERDRASDLFRAAGV